MVGGGRGLTAQRATPDARYVLRYPHYAETRGGVATTREIGRADLLPLRRPLGHALGVGHVPLHAQRQRLDALHDEERERQPEQPAATLRDGDVHSATVRVFSGATGTLITGPSAVFQPFGAGAFGGVSVAVR